MVVLIYGSQYPLISKSCKKFVKSILGDEIDDLSYVRINAKDTTVQDIVYECSLFPFGGKKIVQVDYPYFLSTVKEKAEVEKDQDYDALVNFIENDKDEDVILLFFLEAEKLNERNAVVKALNKNAKIMPVKALDINELRATSVSYFNKLGCSISQDAINLLFERIGEDPAKFLQEATKLSLYKKNIEEEVVAIMVPVPLEQNAFNICDNLIKGHLNVSLRTFRDLLTQKEEPVRILNLLSTQFRNFLSVSYLYTIERLDYNGIAKELNYNNSYRAQMACRTIVNIKYNEIVKVIDFLYKLDCKIKGMEVDPVNGLELFIINFKDIKTKEYTL